MVAPNFMYVKDKSILLVSTIEVCFFQRYLFQLKSFHCLSSANSFVVIDIKKNKNLRTLSPTSN